MGVMLSGCSLRLPLLVWTQKSGHSVVLYRGREGWCVPQRGYKNVIDEGIRLNSVGEEFSALKTTSSQL
ncbi:unnamed protein product [Lactuca virosa]|uniref:Secreted protein n=1 Tax=Lactuca virosa TaxID=75947 RepID=A0AAU9PQB7_9ASTR|nr:unnamed protein product [Lactuca virosa]